MKGIKVSVEQLQPGIFIQLPLKWFQHPFVLNNFKIKSTDQIRIIKKLGVKHVIAFPTKSDNKPLTASEINLKTEATSTDIIELKDELTALKELRVENLKQFRRNINRTEKNFKRKKQSFYRWICYSKSLVLRGLHGHPRLDSRWDQ